MANGDNLILGGSNSATITTSLSRTGKPGGGRFGIPIGSALRTCQEFGSTRGPTPIAFQLKKRSL